MTEPTIKLYRSQSDVSSQLIGVQGTLAINDAVETEIGRVYRRVVYLKIPSDGMANGIVLSQPSLSGSFSSTDLTVRQQSSLLRDAWQFQENNVVVHLQRPWHLKAIHTTLPGEVSLFRMDGEAIADEATLNATTSQIIEPEFVSQHFAMQQISTTYSGFDTSMIIADGGGGGGVAGISVGAEIGGTGVNAQHQQAVYASFHGFTSLILNSYPTTPRVSIPVELLADASELIQDDNQVALELLWQQAGELRETSASDLSSALETVLLPKIASAFELLGAATNELWVPLVFDSDTPCIWTLDEIDLPFQFFVNRFQDSSDRFVMDFSDRNGSPQNLPLPIPAGIVTHASLKIDIGNKDNLNAFPGDSGVVSQKGLLLNSECWYAFKITPSQAGFYGAVSVLISVLTQELNLEAAVVEGSLSPTGQPLGRASASDNWRTDKQWLTLNFDSLRLDATEYWLTLKATSGQCVWLCQDGVDARVRKGLHQSPTVSLQSLTQLAPINQLLTLDYSPQPNKALFTLYADAALVPLTSGENNLYEAQTPTGLNGAVALSVRQIARGKLIFSRPKIEYSPES
ncbi:MAG: hypothetical protein GY875_03150 [Gammaproteobacteria bacterium]|nr:hypothetical protein [Gammaproteobacteria bacterium]